MAKKILYLFPDTNLFIQCRPLQDIDWSGWVSFVEIHLIVCRPIQREIDNQKNRGNDRVGRRARKIYTLFRRIALGTDDYELIQGTTPQVKIFLESPSLPSSELENHLDYRKPDDELVGCLHRFRQEHPDKDAQLLTHDAGPIMTAKSLDLPFVPIKQSWILPPERNDIERENARLKNEIDQLKNTEPQFKIRCIDQHEAEIEKLELEYHSYEPLTDIEQSELMDLIRKKFPLITDFGPREPSEQKLTTIGSHIFGIKEIYTPASDEEIAKYKDQDYPDWIESCKREFSNLHVTLQRNIIQPSFRFAAANKGVRPGKNVLVIFTAKGNFKICPPQGEKKDSEKREEDPGLTGPPRPPRGKWDTVPFSLSAVQDILERNPLLGPDRPLFNLQTLDPDISAIDILRDPDDFFYTSGDPGIPKKSFGLECKQWRHGIDEKYFEGQIFLDHFPDEVRGAIECDIHAENLSKPFKKTVPIKVIIKRMSTIDHARNLIKG